MRKKEGDKQYKEDRERRRKESMGGGQEGRHGGRTERGKREVDMQEGGQGKRTERGLERDCRNEDTE